MITYLMHSGAWSLAGFLLGWLLGQFGRRVLGDHDDGVVVMKRRPITVERLLGAVMVVLAVVTLVTAAIAARQLQDATACQSRYNVALEAVLEARTLSTTHMRQAQREFIAALSTPDAIENPKTRAALDRYRAAIEHDDQVRTQTPLPDPPACGE